VLCVQTSSKQKEAVQRGCALIKVVNTFKKFFEAHKLPDFLSKFSHHINHNLRNKQVGRIKPEGKVQEKGR
jgi:hypothetical protein